MPPSPGLSIISDGKDDYCYFSVHVSPFIDEHQAAIADMLMTSSGLALSVADVAASAVDLRHRWRRGDLCMAEYREDAS